MMLKFPNFSQAGVFSLPHLGFFTIPFATPGKKLPLCGPRADDLINPFPRWLHGIGLYHLAEQLREMEKGL